MAKDIPQSDGTDPLAKPEWAMSRRESRRAERARQGLPPPRRKWPWVLLALLIAALAVGWTRREQILAMMPPPPEEEAAGPGAEAPRITQLNGSEWAVIEPQTLRRTVKVIGTLQPSRRADLSAETAGQIQEVAVRPGDRVASDDVLVQVDVDQLALDLDLARSNAEATRSQLQLAQGQLERAQALVERGVNSVSTVDEAQTSVEQLRATLSAQEDQIEAAELSLARASVRAPFDGVIASRSVEPGAVVSPGSPLLSIVDLSRMEMLASAPVAAGAGIRPGQEVDLQVDGIGGRSFRGTVERIAPVAEEGTRTITVYVAIDNADGVLLGGMFATGEIVLAEIEGALALPRTAIRDPEGQPFVLVIEDGVLARRDVVLGEDWPGDLVEVEGLRAGQSVVTAALDRLEPGEPVDLVDF